MSTYTFTGRVVTKTSFNDDQKISLYASVWGNGGWKENFFNNTISKPCTFIKNLAPGFIKEMAGQIHAKGCPIEPNEYHFTDLPLIFRNITVPIPHGRYKTMVVLLEGDEKLGCAEAIVRIEPQ
ncbi:hypothetical protein O3M35_012578 [Rhynocoris fuscipes]|uniref:MD-2-related lipid-recognition domain-containing protein n=1 Tax=Rhynocoris fuscipes TaxID=488301 RepID=A0AAW1CW11_9HEMI